MNKILWKIVSEEGNALTGFSSEKEAKKGMMQFRTDKVWKVESYVAEDWELSKINN